MDSSQVENAIEVLWSQNSDAELKGQALAFIQQLRNEPSSFQICLPLFTRSPPASEQVRHFALEIVASNVELLSSDAQSLEAIRGNLMDYVQPIYGRNGIGKADTPHIQNKLAQVLTNLFVALYDSTWQSVFDDFLSLAKDGMSAGGNTAAPVLYFRFLGSVHDEIADTMINRTPEKTKRTTLLRDLIRERDALKVANFWQELLSKWQQVDPAVMEMCLRTIARWISWSDISMVVNQPIMTALLEMAGQQDVGEHGSSKAKLRDAAIEAFTAIATKKMRPAEKIELIKVLNLQTVVSQLISSQPLEQFRNTPDYDADLAESVARLVNHIVQDLIVVLDSTEATNETKQEANIILQNFLPFLLRFFADEYDEICSTVIDGLMVVLTFLRRITKDKPGQALPSEYSNLLPSILNAIIQKMRFDDTADWGAEGEESDEAEFQDLRKRLNTLQSQFTYVDENLVVATVSDLVLQTFAKYSTNSDGLDWRDLELALYQMYLFGDYAAKQYARGKSSKPTVAADKLGNMMFNMIGSKIGQHPFPAIQLQFSENCVRYSKFFETNTQWIPNALEAFVGFAHSPNSRVRLPTWYNFHRFTKPLRGHLGEVSQTIIQAIADLLPIKASIASDREDDDDDSSSDINNFNDPVFNSQLYLFETIGCITSPSTIPLESKVVYIQSVINPIFSDMEQNLAAAKAGDERAIMQIHHDIMAFGSLSHGYTDWMPGMKVGQPPPQEVSSEFVRCGEGILLALESLNSSQLIRQAAQTSLGRLLGGMGNRVLPQLPRWIEGLLSQTSSNEDTTAFLHLLTQIIFAFKADISEVLDVILSPLLQRVFERLSEPAHGTDDEVQLGELRRKFLSFVTIVLNNDLGSVLVSSNNQPTFENMISAIEHFARDQTDLSTARLAIGVLIRMTATFGGPDILPVPTTQPPPNSPTELAPTPAIPGFDAFVISRFSPLSWAIPSSPDFKIRDPNGRQLVHEIASLQQEILRKTGRAYVDALGYELQSMGVQDTDREVYVMKLRGDAKGFKEFLTTFLGRGES